MLVLEVFLAEGTAAPTISFSKRVATVYVARLERGLPVRPHLQSRGNRNVTTANKSKTATGSLASGSLGSRTSLSVVFVASNKSFGENEGNFGDAAIYVQSTAEKQP